MATTIHYTKADFYKFLNLQPKNKGFARMYLREVRSWFASLPNDSYYNNNIGDYDFGSNISQAPTFSVCLENHLFRRFVRYLSIKQFETARLNVTNPSYQIGESWAQDVYTDKAVHVLPESEDLVWFDDMRTFVAERIDTYQNVDTVKALRKRERVITYGTLRKVLVEFEKSRFSTAATVKDII